MKNVSIVDEKLRPLMKDGSEYFLGSLENVLHYDSLRCDTYGYRVYVEFNDRSRIKFEFKESPTKHCISLLEIMTYNHRLNLRTFWTFREAASQFNCAMIWEWIRSFQEQTKEP